MVRPNLFIVGAPRCGTTAMASYLESHPEVYLPGTAEMNYLSDDLVRATPPLIQSDEEYFSSFADGAGKPRVGEKSAFYLYSRRAVERIRDISPDAKIICMLRNPVDVMWSLYRYNVANCEEEIRPFEAALKAEPARRRGHRLPKCVSIVDNLFYRRVVRFSEQIERYLAAFSRKNVLVIVFEDFVGGPGVQYGKVLEFLGLTQVELSIYPQKNRSEPGLAYMPLRRFINTHGWARVAVRKAFPAGLPGFVREGLSSLLGGTPVGLQAMAPSTRERLCAEFADEVKRLEVILERDLSAWREVRG